MSGFENFPSGNGHLWINVWDHSKTELWALFQFQNSHSICKKLLTFCKSMFGGRLIPRREQLDVGVVRIKFSSFLSFLFLFDFLISFSQGTVMNVISNTLTIIPKKIPFSQKKDNFCCIWVHSLRHYHSNSILISIHQHRYHVPFFPPK